MKSVLAALCLIALTCSTTFAATRIADNITWYRMHFGTGVGSEAVSPEVMQEFMTKEISSRFPDGFTMTMSRGQWTSPDIGLIRERTMVVDIQCADTNADKVKIDEISNAYVKRFQKAKASVFVMRIPGISTKLTY